MSNSRFGGLMVTAILLVMVVLTSWVATTNFLSKPEVKPLVIDRKIKLNTLLTVSVYDAEGNLKSSVEKPDDLLTAQFINFLGALLKGSSSTTAQTAVLKNDANADKTIKLFDETSTKTSFYTDGTTGTSKKGGLVGIGTGSTAPARSNYALETKVEAYSDISSPPTWDATAGTISLSGNVAITGSRTITEAILGVRWIDSAGTEQVFIFAHDTFAGQAVVNTDVVAVAYVITLTGDEFTTSFGKYLTYLLTTVADGATLGTTYQDITNTARTMYSYKASGYADIWSYYPSTPSQPYAKLKIGTGSGALSRASYELGTPIQEVFGFATQVDTTGITINSSVTTRSSTTINEIGLYLPATNTEAQILFLRILTGGDAVTPSDVYLIEIRIDC